MDKVLTFKLCGGLFGIDITLIKEINRNIEFTPIPGSPPHIVGLFNMRGQIVTLFNLGRLMDYKEENKNSLSTCIIMKSKPNNPNQVGFLIDGTGDVIDIDTGQIEAPPSNLCTIDGEYIQGIVKLQDNLLMLLNLNKILEN
jgi:purine-binding chemotaxis protein CheW